MRTEPHDGGSTASLFEPDILLPTQYLASLQRGRIDEPERCLMLAVLEDAVDSYRKYALAQDPRGQVLFYEAEAWFVSEGNAWPFAFESICDVLDLNADSIRKGLARARPVLAAAAAVCAPKDETGASRHRGTA
jgi:hypothetical protein